MNKPKKKITGFSCRRCKHKMGVYYTIPEKEKIIRGRQCPKCGWIKRTAEK